MAQYPEKQRKVAWRSGEKLIKSGRVMVEREGKTGGRQCQLKVPTACVQVANIGGAYDRDKFWAPGSPT